MVLSLSLESIRSLSSPIDSLKVARSITSVVTSFMAVTLATRSSPVIKALSPKASPLPMIWSTTFIRNGEIRIYDATYPIESKGETQYISRNNSKM